MNESNAVRHSRKTAYAYIMQLFKVVNWDKDLSKDNNVADVLDIKLSELLALKNGEIDPSARLVLKVKEFFNHKSDGDDQIEIYLVKPFI
ncbi:hypothetical protein Dform_00524 [Dehalogenimonas formicexedens]|uniref:Uncharacterized protein n=1 Tax=Dehalogenimonas formicexedens TaxID=1839801 RepID=A0A1P8F5W9_9CHLR|nr:hypothetical protein [Dehalogenimonas formicexedens]APV43879.1 hypothetical protein Dform_00524 [Dehalogenimonas formicexedens]